MSVPKTVSWAGLLANSGSLLLTLLPALLCSPCCHLGGWSGGYSFPVTHRDAPQVLPLTALCTETPSKHNKMSQTRGRGLTNQFCFLYSFLSSACTGTHHAKSWIVSHVFQMKVRISNFTCFNLTTKPFSSLDENLTAPRRTPDLLYPFFFLFL